MGALISMPLRADGWMSGRTGGNTDGWTGSGLDGQWRRDWHEGEGGGSRTWRVMMEQTWSLFVVVVDTMMSAAVKRMTMACGIGSLMMQKVTSAALKDQTNNREAYIYSTKKAP